MVVSVARLGLFPFLIKTETAKYVYDKTDDKETAKKEIAMIEATIYEPQETDRVTTEVFNMLEE